MRASLPHGRAGGDVLDRAGYDTYRVEQKVRPGKDAAVSAAEGWQHANRYGSCGRRCPADMAVRVMERGWTLEELRVRGRSVRDHYDVCGTVRAMLQDPHDRARLSVQFMLTSTARIYHAGPEERGLALSSANSRRSP